MREVVVREEEGGRREEDGGGRARRCSKKNKNPTQQCGEQCPAHELGLGDTGASPPQQKPKKTKVRAVEAPRYRKNKLVDLSIFRCFCASDLIPSNRFGCQTFLAANPTPTHHHPQLLTHASAWVLSWSKMNILEHARRCSDFNYFPILWLMRKEKELLILAHVR